MIGFLKILRLDLLSPVSSFPSELASFCQLAIFTTTTIFLSDSETILLVSGPSGCLEQRNFFINVVEYNETPKIEDLNEICVTVSWVVQKGNVTMGSDHDYDHHHHHHHHHRRHHRHHHHPHYNITSHDAFCPQNKMRLVEAKSIDILELQISIVSCLLQTTVFPGASCRIVETVIEFFRVCFLSHNLITT